MSIFKPYLYGAYGSNLNKAQMRYRCPEALPCETLVLHNHALVFRGVADIEEVRGQSVTLGLWMITEQCERALDRYEGFPHLYTKQFIDTDAGQVMVYTMCDQTDVHPPTYNYLASICKGYDDFAIDRALIKTALDHSYMKQAI